MRAIVRIARWAESRHQLHEVLNRLEDMVADLQSALRSEKAAHESTLRELDQARSDTARTEP